ncbi:hypothetical protein [Spiroplasma sp. DGKH1]|uniref:hypothetical protein n=1 Tax=Spiroplasma sp. DGKH1 TaxID=3050074 RepID=UPI0034C62E1F
MSIIKPELWEGVNLQEYNESNRLTGPINEVPLKYNKLYSNVEEWFTTFAIQAQDDINAYLNFIFYKFPYHTFRDQRIKEIIRKMIYIMIEHWCFNRIPIEFIVTANNRSKNGNNFEASSNNILNLQGLHPSRMKIYGELTSLKKLFETYNENPNEIDLSQIDLEFYYTKSETDQLISLEKNERKENEEKLTTTILQKQLKLYDDVISSEDSEVKNYKGPITNLVIKGPVATGYDSNTETAVFDIFNEIGHIDGDIDQQGQTSNEGGGTHAISALWAKNREQDINLLNNNVTNLSNNLKVINNNLIHLENRLLFNNELWEEVKNEAGIPWVEDLVPIYLKFIVVPTGLENWDVKWIFNVHFIKTKLNWASIYSSSVLKMLLPFQTKSYEASIKWDDSDKVFRIDIEDSQWDLIKIKSVYKYKGNDIPF